MRDMMKKARAIRAINESGAQALAKQGNPDDVITAAMYFPEWEQRAYSVGDTVMWSGQPTTCLQAHDASVNPNWTPETSKALWRPWHAWSPDLALLWVQPLGAGYEYKAGEYMR